MKVLLVIAAALIFVAIFIPSACSAEKRQQVVSPDRHDFLGFREFVAEYGRPGERAWALGTTEGATPKQEAPSAPAQEVPPYYGF